MKRGAGWVEEDEDTLNNLDYLSNISFYAVYTITLFLLLLLREFFFSSPPHSPTRRINMRKFTFLSFQLNRLVAMPFLLFFIFLFVEKINCSLSKTLWMQTQHEKREEKSDTPQ